ncbi:Protein CBR-SAM-10 [Caenorhabditis briggsae]|uniref:LisH domain-containing protein n=2 Tax=Caenorhabditis briggsae TaxID=6238 RepID=A0AAE9J898_CAEBR|nr:Protein CBR-SAM-10 [Caenorhabditis briggsae]ULU07465.1 hypothetical protein L3Y34_018884 [Caenorhabditis briggsae]UMM19379.1 hypothetical protein L5515_015004 [Caenorhabditis briggsae]CAP37745.2 Protein CBR-SAM-10 [Caenorhabditis briggsae]
METPHEDPFMFQPRGGGGGLPPGMQMQQPMQPPQMQQQQQPPAITEIAKDRLTTYVYEFLLQTGATKTAEAFKEEVLNQNPALQTPVKPSEKTFLLDWWGLFWDLWSAAPERRELGEQPPMFSTEAKYFHDSMIGMPPGMNGHFGPPMGMEMMGGHPGAYGGRFPPGRMAPTGMPPGAFPPMFNPGMPRMPNPGMRMAPPGPPFSGGMGRPGGMGEMPGMPRYDFMGPGGVQQFAGPSGSGMLPNGGMPPHMSLNSPNMGPPPGGDPNMPGTFMGMPPMPPTSSSAMPFGMTEQPMSAGPTGGAPGPGTPGMGGSVPGGGPGSVPPQATTSAGSVGTPSSMGHPQMQTPKQENMSNGEEMKTEAMTPTGASCGSVGAPVSSAVASVSMNGGGPGSAPGSAHSVNNNVNPSTPSGGPMSNPLSNPMSNPASGQNPGSADAFKDDSEGISKIREGLLDGFKTEVTGAGWD